MTKRLRCAIYTRKSSEEGLDQSFNSLDAQREAAEAYIASQASEGWTLLPARYDDGGYSGGTMERPGLQRLLADIAAGRVDVVVVYKIDRLTRSLTDFARIVETFEKAQCSFVSVTQSFNTTNSMGRLMLNVLLSFAQFEREVTGERIRDKIAASKAKGMWMGGLVPLGYDLPIAGTRTLRVNETEAATVRHIYSRYLELGSVHALQRELESQNVCSKLRVTLAGRTIGGGTFSRGALFHMLRNPLYLGRIAHKGKLHPGEHPAILDEALFEHVQRRLDEQARRRATCVTRSSPALLVGKLFDAAGAAMSPTRSQGKAGRTYRYYVSAPLQQGSRAVDKNQVGRLPAVAIERIVEDALARWLPQESDTLHKLHAVHLTATGLTIELAAIRPGRIATRLGPGEALTHHQADGCTVHLPLALPLRGGRRQILAGHSRKTRVDATLVAALRKAHAMLARDKGQPVLVAAPASPYERRLLRLAFLAPSIQHDILNGRQPASLNLEALMSMDIPLAWSRQYAALGWPLAEIACYDEQQA